MAIREVLQLGNPGLREISQAAEDDQMTAKIVDDLRDTLTFLQEKHQTGRALAAPQIGYKKHIIYANLPEEEIVMINPEIKEYSQEEFMVWDSCFSFSLAFFVKISRYREIKVEYQDESGRTLVRNFKDDLAELFQHEIDHLKGVLATDHLTDGKNIIMREEWEKTIKNSERSK